MRFIDAKMIVHSSHDQNRDGHLSLMGSHLEIKWNQGDYWQLARNLASLRHFLKISESDALKDAILWQFSLLYLYFFVISFTQDSKYR